MVDDFDLGPETPRVPKSDAYVVGYAEAERQFNEEPDYRNPFEPGTAQHHGYEDGMYDFTNK